MTVKFEFSPKPESLPELFENAATLLKPLSEHGPVALVKAGGEATVDYEGNAPVGKVKFALGVKGNTGIGAFNAANDEDDDGVYSGKPAVEATRETAAGGFEKVVLPPTLFFTEGGSVWTKYHFQATPLVTGDITFPFGFNFKFDASKSVIFADYQRHASTDVTLAALTEDLGRLRFAGDADHVADLPEGDALYYSVRGVLDAKLTFTWSDTFSFALSDLSVLLGKGQSLSIDVGASASVEFRLALHDDFRLVFSKRDERVKVALLKAKSQELGVKVDAGLKVGFANPDQLTEALNRLFEAVVGSQLKPIDDVVAKIDAMVEKATFANLTDEQQQIARFLAARLGLGSAASTVDEMAAKWGQLKEKWAKIKNAVPEAIKKAVNTKVGLGFKYEYLRMDSEEELAAAHLTPEALREVHQDLLLLDLDRFLTAARQAPNELVTYLNQKTKLRRDTWGFTLNVGKWTLLSSKDTRQVRTITQRNIEGKQRLAFDSLRSYEDESNNEKHLWTVNLKAEMNDFSDRLDYRAMDYGLHLKYYTLEKEIDAAELRQNLDYALLWDSLTPQGLVSALDDLEDGIGESGAITAEILIGNKELRRLAEMIERLPEAESERIMARSFAKALPFARDLRHFRAMPANRANVYTDLWLWCFDNPEAGHSELRRVIYQTLDNIDPELAKMEELAPQMYHFAWQVESHAYNGARKSFLKGLDKLSNLFTEPTADDWDPDELVGAYKSLRDLWTNRLYVRAAGAFLLDVARRDAELYSNIKRVCTIKFGGEVPRVVTLSANTQA
jgi:hypothetical protein